MFGTQENQKSESAQNASQPTGTGQKEKVCFKCGETKKLTEFYKHPRMADGHVNKCKECNKKDVSENYRVNIDHFKKYERSRANLPHRVKARKEYAQTETGKIKGNRAKAQWSLLNPEKRKVTNMVGNAVRGKKIKKQPCEVCGSTTRTHGHHEDYTKPFDVIWLCPKHHSQWHKLKR